MMEHPLNVSMLFGMEFSHTYWHVVMTFIVLLLVILVGSFSLRAKAEVPGRGQNAVELLVKGIYGMCDDVMGPHGRPYIPVIFGIGLYVAFSNLIGLIPGFLAPTSNLNSTVAPAIVVFLLYQYIGIKTHGAHYIHHFLGPVVWLAPLMLIIELIGHLARPLSLSMRLFGNIFGEELVIVILFILVPFLVPLPMFMLGVFTGLLQAYVFMMLSMIYISGALEEAH
ncbi:ATP synthase F0 subcomplex A subunit [Seleniivibrio woodruffii]|uniref:ATP synthase subunit a n=2 Tax=Seleniivibrio woodruffii TaxID=1078050 RepID=A0A4R1K6X7_9BACT|nr:F0F1 ATP synthase subunit A [Seleniivibrio woodruffii]TCK59964.1 ATP synthase F0 subcomplex A subunit [Seleniivibrio woodruffii]TVZ35815.1 ATP synthase F0 subcomplex A subunit [Seleniivibrio woodruffii]